MCTALECLKEEGREEGIKGTVDILRGLGIEEKVILEKLQEQYQLSEEKAKGYLKV